MTANRRFGSLLVGVVVLAATLTGGMGVAAQEAPGPPANFYGTVETEDGTPAPPGTTIVAVVDGQGEGEITVSEAGVYGGEGSFAEKLSLDSTAGDSVRFRLERASGTEAIAGSPRDLDAGLSEQNLTFPAGAFADPTPTDTATPTETATPDDETSAGGGTADPDGEPNQASGSNSESDAETNSGGGRTADSDSATTTERTASSDGDPVGTLLSFVVSAFETVLSGIGGTISGIGEFISSVGDSLAAVGGEDDSTGGEDDVTQTETAQVPDGQPEAEQDSDTRTETESSASGAGFGPVVAVLALLGFVLVAARRRQ